MLKQIQPYNNNNYGVNENYIKNIEKYNLRKKSSGIGFYVFAYMFVMIGVANIISVVLMLLCGINDDLLTTASTPMFLMNIFVSVFAAFIPALFYCLFTKTNISQTVSVKYVKQSVLWPLVFIGMSVAMIANAASNIVAENFSIFGLTNSIDFNNSSNSVFVNILYIVSTAIVPAFAEEFAFRGIIMGSMRKYGDGFAIIVSAVMFGAMHGNIAQIPFAFILGLVFAYIDCKTNSIIPSIIIHFLNNFYAVALDILNTSGVLSDRKYLEIYYIIICVIVVLGILGFLFLLKKNKNFFKLTDKATTSSAPSLTLKEKNIAFFINLGVILSLSIFLLETILYLVI